MDLTIGNPKIKIGLIDGPVLLDHPDLQLLNIRAATGSVIGCMKPFGGACGHGTFIAGILSGKRGSASPAICPGCTLIVRPIFIETYSDMMPSATPKELANAIIDCVNAGTNVINLSVGLSETSSDHLHVLKNAIDHAANNGVIIVAASGNQGFIGGTSLTNHHWVISVVACDEFGKPMGQSNLGFSIKKWGLMAPGKNIYSLMADGSYSKMSGTSVAAPFVSGAVALLWSLFPGVPANLLRSAITLNKRTEKSIVPPLFDAWNAYKIISNISESF